MKKFTFYQNMVASWAAAVALAVALSAGLSACDKDEDNGSDTELYKPSKDMTYEQIVALFKEVDANMAAVRQVSGEKTEIENDGDKEIYQFQLDLDAKKELLVFEYKGGVLGGFIYTENDIAYYNEYNNDQYNNESSIGNEIGSYKISDAYWNNSEVFEEFIEDVDITRVITDANSKWKVENDVFVGTFTEDGITGKAIIAITASKKLSSIKAESKGSNEEDSYVMEELKYTYSASPALPSGYKKSDFPLAKQYSVKVVWGEGRGESTFYFFYSDSYVDFDPYDIIRYAPKVPSMRPKLYSDKDFKQEVYSISLSDNNMVIYVKWVSDSESTGKSKGKPAAKSRLFR
ncbi:MAG: hypothetical protein LBB79_03160 [Prevotellaceae bacterium]|jgi:hypothetical protein|nr:hypothetical protein [Prevotellaceae bacterium]